jgi:hypothetical protein
LKEVLAVHKSLEEMVQELVQKSNLIDSEINALVGTDDVKKIDVAVVLKRAELLAIAKVFPIGEMHRAEILVRSIHAAELILHAPVTNHSEESQMERHHEKMSNGLNSVAHLNRDALDARDKTE